MSAIARCIKRRLLCAAPLLALALICGFVPCLLCAAHADGVGAPVVVLKNPIPGDMPNINPPARVVVYDSGLVLYRPEHSRPITAESTTIDYRSYQLSPREYRSVMRSLPLKQAFLQTSWISVFMPQIVTFNHGAHSVGVEPANFTMLYPQPSAAARYTAFRILESLHSPDAAVYTAPTYSMRLYPTTRKYSRGPAAVWPVGVAGIALPADAVHGAPRTDRRYSVEISGAQYRQALDLLAAAHSQNGLVSIDGKFWLLEFTPHLPDAGAWGGDEQEDFLITRDAIHGDIPNNYPDW